MRLRPPRVGKEVELDEHEVRKELMHFFTGTRCPFCHFQQSNDVVLDRFDIGAGTATICKPGVEMMIRQTFTGPIAKGLERSFFARGDRPNCSPVTVNVDAEVRLFEGVPTVADDVAKVGVRFRLADRE